MQSNASVRNARDEAQQLIGGDRVGLVLEPSPPAVRDDNFFADDPVAAPSPSGAVTDPPIQPSGIAGASTWNDWLAENAANDPDGAAADWVSARWLGGNRRLGTPPASLATTRTDLHRLGAYAIAPVRHTANGKFGLRWTLGGFGTPFFGDDRQIRVEGTQLVDQRGDEVRSAAITSLAAAATFLGSELRSDAGAEPDSPELGDAEAPLNIDPDAAEFIGNWFGMGFAGLEALRADPKSVEPSRPQLWPGHFDPAIELGDEDHRASYGASPGDHTIDEPYLYVSIWWPDKIAIDRADDFWNAPSFVGAILRLSDFAADADPVIVARDFWAAARDKMG